MKGRDKPLKNMLFNCFIWGEKEYNFYMGVCTGNDSPEKSNRETKRDWWGAQQHAGGIDLGTGTCYQMRN